MLVVLFASILFAFPDSVTGVLLVAVRIYVVLAIGLIVIRSPRSSWRRSMASVTSTPSGGNGSGTPRTSLIGEHYSFDTGAPELQWLTRAIFVGTGERDPAEVVIRVWKVD